MRPHFSADQSLQALTVTRHGSSLIQISLKGLVNCYLIQEEDGLTLIDTTVSGSAPAITEITASLRSELRRVLLTHAHHDHAGSLDALMTGRPALEIMLSAREARLLAGDHRLEPDEPQHEPGGEFTRSSARATRFLRGGDRVGSLLVIASSGHTPGHLSFLDTRDGSLIAGDAYANVSEAIVSGVFTPQFPVSAKVTWHKPTALESAKRLRDLQPRRLACGHGSVLENPLPAMIGAIERAEVT